jgi:two-component system, NtrC family, response regulator AlgB
MDTASASDSLDHQFSASAVEPLPDFAAPGEVLEEETPLLADVPPLLRTRNPRMTATMQSAKRAALVPATVLLIGENGAGKRLLARQIHNWCPSNTRRFVGVDCARISGRLVEAETLEIVTRVLTGHDTDDNTNGYHQRPGTIFLENIADLELGAQAKLLDFVDAQRVNRLSKKSGKGWTKIIAASNNDLASAVLTRKFRADLFYRINVVSLRIPALRERPEDILRLAESMLRQEATRYGRRRLQFSAGAQFAIQHRPWLANAPELASAIESAAVLSADDLIKADDIPEVSAWYSSATPANASAPAQKLCEVERNHIAKILASGVSAEEAAEILGISSSTLCRKRKRYDLC